MVPSGWEEKEAEKLREEAKICFLKGKIAAAIDFYTQAITLCPDVAVNWTNRAICHRKRNDWSRVEEDCRKALQLDSKSVKAPYMLGLALLQRQEYAEGVKELRKALDHGRGAAANSLIVEEIWKEFGKAKFLEWEQTSAKRLHELHNLKEVCRMALKQKYFLEKTETEGFMDLTLNSHLEQLAALDRIFYRATESDTPTDVPDYLCCKITLDILRDPVIAPSGVTYERAVILEHLQKVGKFDPVTREALHQQQLVPNLSIKEAVDAFLDKHGWAYNMD